MNTTSEIAQAIREYGSPCVFNGGRLCTKRCMYYEQVPELLHDAATQFEKAGNPINVVAMIQDLGTYRAKLKAQTIFPLEMQLTDAIAMQNVTKGEHEGCLSYPKTRVKRNPAIRSRR